MAGIDKTYLNWQDYCTLKEWCEGKSFIANDGTKVYPSDFLYTWEEEVYNMYLDSVLPVWNTPTYFDLWLMRNCPLSFIQARLEEQYGDIEETLAEYDNFNRQGLGKDIKYRILRRPKFNSRWYPKYLPRLVSMWEIIVEGDYDYNETADTWNHYMEAMPFYSDNCLMKNFNLKKFHRKLKKWNLPKGVEINVIGPLDGQNWQFITK